MEALPPGPVPGLQEGLHPAPGVHQGEDPGPEEVEVRLEAAGVDHPPRHGFGPGVPEVPGEAGELAPEASVPGEAVRGGLHAQEARELVVVQDPEGGDPECEAGELGPAHVHGDHLLGVEGEEGEGVVPRRRHGQQPPSRGGRRQGAAEDVGVLPDAPVADLPEGGALLDRALDPGVSHGAHRSLPAAPGRREPG